MNKERVWKDEYHIAKSILKKSSKVGELTPVSFFSHLPISKLIVKLQQSKLCGTGIKIYISV